MSSVETYQKVPLEAFRTHFSNEIELSSVALGGSIQSVSDEFFADAFHLLLVEPALSLKGQFGPKGALFSGWETRRHNPDHDWCIIKLGTTGNISGFDIDTSHFNGNEAPEVTVHALFSTGDISPTENDVRWTELLPRVGLGPNSRHLFKIPASSSVNYVKLSMYPDGGIARFRVYGLVSPVIPQDPTEIYDLAHVFAGGRVVYTSDQHFGVGSNLILPGRGKDMGDGWETKRSRQPGHHDYAVIKLGSAGVLSHAEIDTAHFKGNFPESSELHAVHSDKLIPDDQAANAWTQILPRTKLGPHRQHQFQLENVGKPYTHVRVTIYPDGGIKRVRLFGVRSSESPVEEATTEVVQPNATVTTEPTFQSQNKERPGHLPAIPALSLTPEAFAPFGQVIQSYPDIHAVPQPRNTRITGANQGTAIKYHKLAPVVSSYPEAANATAGLSVYRCEPIPLAPGGVWPVKLLERHPCTNQAFIPMGSVTGADLRYLVVVAKNGADDKPDLTTLRAFVAAANQGIVYDTGIWHHPMAVLEGPMDFTCVETQVGNGDPLDCEIVSLDVEAGIPTVVVPFRK
ncbi:allantoicase [Cristinia sonorae]|uniref:Allantoicase n=1 Tax=Cristinia sonorae TaxID=1940300 RepID=A0A8K0XMM7_9AGAR|nr:allantoicase [Cristinia sonorae]